MKKFLFLFILICFILAGCNKADLPDEPSDSETKNEEVEYTPTDTTLSFSDDDLDKVITEATFDISLYTANAGTKLKPYQLFSDGMCLQRDAVNRIWGKVSGSKNIAIEFNGKVYYGNVNMQDFEVYLPKMNAGGPYELTIISEAGRMKLTNIYVGEVFLLSGQSNMEFQPQHAGSLLKDLYSTKDCIDDEIRMLQMGWSTPTEPSLEAINSCVWKGANQTTIPKFTAVGYLFGKQMHEELGCPVGLIANPVGGSSIEFWLSDVNYNKVLDYYKPYTTTDEIMTPSLGYNGMLYPLTGINIRSVLWYQGESNAFGTQQYYDKALKIFMEQCREMFNNPNLAFTICELARYEGNPYAYSVVNEKINSVALEDPYTVVARNLDLGEWKDIHPKDKRTVASRAAYETLRVFFKKDKAEPIKVNDYTFNEDGSVTISLSTDAMLVNGTNGFEVYVDGKYTYDCNVSIDKNKLTVSSSGEITRVRYGYTCLMNEEIMNDVSKMVTVYDLNGLPLDLFIISKDEEVKPNPNPTPSVDPNAPTVTVGWVDTGYMVSTEDNQFIINKYASAAQWTGATLDIENYSSDYSAFTIKFTSTNVTKLTIQLFVEGESDWLNYVSVYSSSIAEGENELYIDFTAARPVNESWETVSGYFIKDYDVKGIIFSLDTAVEESGLKNEDASIIIHSLTFNKVNQDNLLDPNAPTLAIGWNDEGYKTTKNTTTNEFIIEKDATALQWTCSSLDIVNYSSLYSAFTIKFTTTNVTNFSIQLYVLGIEDGWSNYVSVYDGIISDGEHELYIDFTNIEPVDLNWQNVPGYFIKDYDVVSIKILLDTSVEASNLVNIDATCVIHEITFNKINSEETLKAQADIDSH